MHDVDKTTQTRCKYIVVLVHEKQNKSVNTSIATTPPAIRLPQ